MSHCSCERTYRSTSHSRRFSLKQGANTCCIIRSRTRQVPVEEMSESDRLSWCSLELTYLIGGLRAAVPHYLDRQPFQNHRLFHTDNVSLSWLHG
jgi:hypothetical protein